MSNSVNRTSVAATLGAAATGVSGERDSSLSAVATSLSAVGGGDKAEIMGSIMLGKALGDSMGLKSRGEVSRHFDDAYDTVLTAMVAAMSGGPSGLTIAQDTDRGAYLQGSLPQDLFSSPGKISFEVVDCGARGTVVVGHSEIPGQMFAWGKGTRALNAVLESASDIAERL